MASKLTDEELLDRVQKRLHKLRIPFLSVGISEKKGKKLRLTLMDGHTVDFGAAGSQTYLEGASEAKKKAYLARHSKIYLKNGKRAIDMPYSPAWLSLKVLWDG